MPSILLPTLSGRWTGSGLNHVSQPYTGRLIVNPINPGATILTFTATGADGEIYHTETITLTLGDLTDEFTFRETITLHLTPDLTLHQTYAWAMPGEPIQPRSTSHLTRLP